jgi:flagellar protein FlbD
MPKAKQGACAFYSSLNLTVIKVSRLNGKTFIINALYIETIESFPDTTITLTNGHKYIIKEREEEVQKLILAFYQSINILGQQLGGNDQDEE